MPRYGTYALLRNGRHRHRHRHHDVSRVQEIDYALQANIGENRTVLQLEGTHRVRSHTDDWLRHLANVDESRF